MVSADMDSYVHAGADGFFRFAEVDRTEPPGFAARVEDRGAFSDLDIFLSPDIEFFADSRCCFECECRVCDELERRKTF